MALVSPGVEVTVIDESQYLPAPLNSIPFVLLATAQDKANPTGTGVAAGTTAANAGKLFQVTSQRDLVTLYGNPFFYTTSNGTPIQGYELNEYGLLAAYSALGASNRIYCLRADVDLASLVGQTGRPSGDPEDGTYWLDTTTSTWGINVFNATTGQFTLQTPIVITDPDSLTGNFPVRSIGAAGDYAVNAIPQYTTPSAATAAQFFYKNDDNNWVQIGSSDWLASWPTVQGTDTTPGTLTTGNTLTIQISGGASLTLTVGAGDDIDDLIADINSANYATLQAANVGGALTLYSTQTSGTWGDTAPYSLTISGSAQLLTDVGITAGTYYQPGVAYGTSAQQPLWSASQTYPRPTGSVWFKVGQAGSGLDVAISEYDSVTQNWLAKTLSYATTDAAANAALDSTGGKNIPAGSVYVQYNYESISALYRNVDSPLYYWERIAEGPTVITGTTAFATPSAASFTAGPYTISGSVSVPGSSSSTTFSFALADNASANDFITAWSNAAIPYTTATITEAGYIQLTHTQGGTIVLSSVDAANADTLITALGFVVGTTTGVKLGYSSLGVYSSVVQGESSGSGSNFAMTVRTNYQQYYFNSTTFDDGGSGYAVGDTITLYGADLGGTTPTNNLVIKVLSIGGGGATGPVTGATLVSGTAAASYSTQLSNWVEFDMTANEGAPVAEPTNGTNWFYSVVDEVDILINTTSGWKGYRNQPYDVNGLPLPSGAANTDPNGPIVSASEPTTQSDGTALVYGDIWIDTSDLENYPLINRWQNVDGDNRWVLVDNTDQTSSSGVLFADARWSNSGAVDPVNDPIPSIVTLLTSNYYDLDAPESSLYPVGMMLFNTRRSGYNVKEFRTNYFTSGNYPEAGAYNPGSPTNVANLPDFSYTWVTISGNQANGSPYMGRKAQRAVVVQALRAAIDSNTAIRDEDNAFNLIACPNYPELQPNMVVLNNDRGQTGFIIGDTPMRLPDDATAIQAWATNAAGATSTGEEGLVTRDTYLGLFYPSGITSDLSGNLVAVPPSHMMIRTILRNDTIAYPWFAPAGTRRGQIDNATSIGYIDSTTGEFVVIKTRIGIRDVLYINQINPLVFFTGNGLLNYGNKSSYNSQSALDRINVARLVAYIRRQLTIAARPFIFEPNDAITRQQIAGVIQTLMVDLVAKRGIYDYLVVCDESNNTPARIDRNELWVDVAIEPVKAVEFIYIPVRVFNTGEIASQ